MVRFVINEPGHKRWDLDGRHYYNGVMIGDDLKISVFEKEDFTKVKFSRHIKISDPDWKAQAYEAQKEAERQFPRPLRSFQVKAQGAGTVAITLRSMDLNWYNNITEGEQREYLLDRAWELLTSYKTTEEPNEAVMELCRLIGVQEARRAFQETAEIEEVQL